MGQMSAVVGFEAQKFGLVEVVGAAVEAAAGVGVFVVVVVVAVGV